MRPAVFLDRDGTINVDTGYVFRPEDFEFLPGAVEAIKRLNDAGYLVLVVSNQSSVARGFSTEADVENLHRYVAEELSKHGARIDRFYYCPHHPEGEVAAYRKNCDCRKPGIGMFRQACRDFEIDVVNSWMIGDKGSDEEFGQRAGLITICVGEKTLYEIAACIITNNTGGADEED